MPKKMRNKQKERIPRTNACPHKERMHYSSPTEPPCSGVLWEDWGWAAVQKIESCLTRLHDFSSQNRYCMYIMLLHLPPHTRWLMFHLKKQTRNPTILSNSSGKPVWWNPVISIHPRFTFRATLTLALHGRNKGAHTQRVKVLFLSQVQRNLRSSMWLVPIPLQYLCACVRTGVRVTAIAYCDKTDLFES